MLRADENYSLTSLEQNSLKKYTSEQIAEKIYDLGESNPLKWNQIIFAILTILTGTTSYIFTVAEDIKKNESIIDNQESKDIVKELAGVKYVSYVMLAYTLFGSGFLHRSKRNYQRKRRELLTKLTMKNII